MKGFLENYKTWFLSFDLELNNIQILFSYQIWQSIDKVEGVGGLKNDIKVQSCTQSNR